MDNYIGEIRMFAGNFAPQGWAFCNGALLNIADNDTLFTLLGTTYGGDGQTTFGLPDLQGRLPISQGQGSGLSSRTLGQAAGEETHLLVSSEMASHTHVVSAGTAAATTITPGSGVIYGTATPNGDTYGLYTSLTPPDVNAAQMATGAVANVGGNQAHDNSMPTLTINFIIALQGIYPTQN